MVKVKPVVIYARYSPTGRVDVESNEFQREKCRQWADLFDRPILGEFADEAASGKDDQRPGLQKALARVCKCRGVLVVYKIDRFARNALDALTVAEKIKAAKAYLASVEERFDTSTETGELFFKLLAVFAEFERKQITARTREAMIRHQANGRCVGSRAPYGYKIELEKNPPGQRRPYKFLVPERSEQAILNLALHLRADGLSVRKICAYLDEKGYRRRNGEKWLGVESWFTAVLAREAGRSR